jgi:chromosome segregation ATPase
MRLTSARVQKYRSIRDTGWFDVEPQKTIMVGVNEAGKSAALQALQQVNPPDGVAGFDALRDYPRSEYNDLSTGAVDPENVEVVSVKFSLDKDDIAKLPAGYENVIYMRSRYLSNRSADGIEGGPARVVVNSDLTKDLARMAAHADKQYSGETAAHRGVARQLLHDYGPGHGASSVAGRHRCPR